MNAITFTHAADRKLRFDQTTCESTLMSLGALVHTKSSNGEFATDAAGLEVSRDMAKSAGIASVVHVQSIGEMMAYADIDNISKSAMSDIGWLLVTLGRHAQEMINLQDDLDDALRLSGIAKY
jgi:hypothetical protein